MSSTAERPVDEPSPAAATFPRARATADASLGASLRGLVAAMPSAHLPGSADFSMAMADVAAVLFARVLKFDAADPRWPDRDRFVMSAAAGTALLYALLHATGHDGMDAGELARFRTLDAVASGHPERGHHPAIEVTSGPAAQGFAAAAGLALGERLMAARYGKSLVDHRTWVMAEAGELATGLGLETLLLAGQMRLEKLAVLVAEPADAGDDLLRRAAACGWSTRAVAADDAAQIAAALALAVRAKKPMLIACRIAAAEPATAPLDDTAATRWHAAGARGATPRRSWLKRAARHALRADFDRTMAGRLPDGFHEAAAALRASLAQDADAAPDAAGARALAALAAAIPELTPGAAEAEAGLPAPPAAALPPGRAIAWGPRPQAMAAAMNGLAAHGGVIPAAAALLSQADALRPTLRLAARMRLRLVHVLTQDGLEAGEHGPALLPLDQLAGLRALPDVQVFRPACPLEVAECWDLALRRMDGPSVLVLGATPFASPRGEAPENLCARGAYVLEGAEAPRAATLIASGGDLPAALAARALLAEEGVEAAVVSMPCWHLFAQQDAAYQQAVLGAAPRFAIEAAGPFGWERWLGADGTFIGPAGFLPGGPVSALLRHAGLTADVIAAAVRRRLTPV